MYIRAYFYGFAYMKVLLKKITTIFFTFIAKRSLGSTTSNIKVNKYSLFTKKTTIGKNSHFNGMKVTGLGSCEIGSNFHSGFGCIILTSQHNFYGKKLPYDNTHIIKNTKIGDNVWFGINVTILPGVSIGNGAIIQAGSFVVSDIPDLAFAGGHPAKVFAKRDMEHYNKLLK